MTKVAVTDNQNTRWSIGNALSFDDTTPAKTVEGVASVNLASNGFQSIHAQVVITFGASANGNATVKVRTSADGGTTKDTILTYEFDVEYTVSTTKRVPIVIGKVAWVEIGVYNGNAATEDITISGTYAGMR